MTIRSHIAKRYIFIPFIYLFIIVLLFFLQFTENLTQHESIYDLSLTARLKNSRSNQLRSVKLSFNGLIIDLNMQKELRLEQDRTQVTVNLDHYEINDTTLKLLFEKNIEMNFHINQNNTDALYIYLSIPPDMHNTTSLSLPYSFAPSAALSNSTRAEAINLEYANNFYSLLLPTGSTTKDGYISVPITLGKNTIRYTTLQTRATPIDVAKFTETMPTITKAEKNRIIQQYIDEAYLGWKETRYNGGSSTWDMYNAPARFSENALVAYLSEAWKRNEYMVALQQMLRAAALHSDSLSFLSAPFLGNLQEISSQYLAEDTKRNEQLLRDIQNRSPAIFSDYNIIEYVQLRSSPVVQKALLEALPSFDDLSADIEYAIGMLHSYLQDYQNSDIPRLIQHFRVIGEEILLPRILKVENNIFLETTTNEIDMRQSLHAGILIEKLGEQENNNSYIQIGRSLITSVLSLAEDSFFPASLFISEQTLEPNASLLGPEAIYDLIHDSPHYPHYTAFQNVLGEQSWVWSVIETRRIEVDATSLSITFNSEPDYTHFLIINNIPEFSNMELFGLLWRDDPSFEFYARGRHYDAVAKVLMIKYNDNIAQNTMRLLYAQQEQ